MKRIACVAALVVIVQFSVASPVMAQAAGCCQLPGGADARSDGAAIISLPFPFPLPFPQSGCFQTDSATLCETLGGTHYQLGVCAAGTCQPTAPAGEATISMHLESRACYPDRPVRFDLPMTILPGGDSAVEDSSRGS